MFSDDIKPNKSQDILSLYSDTRSGSSTAVFGVSDSLAAYLSSFFDGRILLVAKDAVTARNFADDLTAYTGTPAVYLPPKDDVLLYKKFFNKESLYARITALYRIYNGARYICTVPEALLQGFPSEVNGIKLAAASEYRLDLLISDMVRMGYKRTEFAEHKGEFAVRGDIFEVYPINSEDAFRCDFFGDEIESVKIIDVDSHVAISDARSVLILPAIDFNIAEDEVNGLIAALTTSFRKFKVYTAAEKARRIFTELSAVIDSGNLADYSLAFLYPLLKSTVGPDKVFGGDFTFVFIEPKMLSASANNTISEHLSRFQGLNAAGEAYDFSASQIGSAEKLYDFFNSQKGVSFQNITSSVSFFKPNKTLRLAFSPISRYSNHHEDLPVDLANWQKGGYRAVIATGTAERANRLKDTLADSGIISTVTDAPGLSPGVYLVPIYVKTGFVLHSEKLAFIGTCDVFLSGIKEKKLIKRRKDTFSAPEVGDFAVHEVHGIGIVRGTERISTTESTKDYVAIEYAGGDFLYVPVEHMDKLTKYLGSEKSPHLNKIGGMEFDKIKQRARASISRMTINLKKLYRERAEKKGFAFSKDNELSAEFDDAFEFPLTEDQAQSVAEIKRDMESDKIMDRLLMGDVGFGKTEVAFRAAFKAICDGKQVAFMTPTTILSEQHYRTAVDRFKGFGVKIAVLNRFVSSERMKEYLSGIRDGSYSLIIGTHRLLGKDVVFNDLGLLILDEEQCFGVEAKEKLRALKSNVDTLTMTATPIPRTLHMSLSGIREMSLINTPPMKRIPVETYVLEESDASIRDAVLKELSRGGQTFILYNRVETIDRFYGRIAALLPEAKIVVCHGQMDKRTLEDNMMAFYNGKYDVLICTTIIENGIDLPNANTLIVIDADKFGLFTLYQLKGRVGRSDRRAHAYFTFKPDKVVTDTAYQRLSALIENTELGSGYKIAMRDLEIRGAGNILGKEQHGHMDKIGYELYSRLLREQLGEVTKDYETELDVRLDAFIPDSYIETSSSRMDVYKEIAEISSAADRARVEKSIAALYGPLPEEVKNLIDVAELKYLAKVIGAVKVTVTKELSRIVMKDINDFSGGGLNAALSEYKGIATLSFDENPIITIALKQPSAVLHLRFAAQFIKFSLENQK